MSPLEKLVIQTKEMRNAIERGEVRMPTFSRPEVEINYKEVKEEYSRFKYEIKGDIDLPWVDKEFSKNLERLVKACKNFLSRRKENDSGFWPKGRVMGLDDTGKWVRVFPPRKDN